MRNAEGLKRRTFNPWLPEGLSVTTDKAKGVEVDGNPEPGEDEIFLYILVL